MTERLPTQGCCPDCGAENALTATKCWMCGRTAWVAAAPASQPALATDIWLPQTPADVRQEPSFWVKYETTLALSALVVLVTAGVWLHEPALGILMVLLIDLPLLITISASLLRPMTRGQKVGTFLKWLAVMAGSVIFMAAVAIVVMVVAFISMITALAQMCGCVPK